MKEDILSPSRPDNSQKAPSAALQDFAPRERTRPSVHRHFLITRPISVATKLRPTLPRNARHDCAYRKCYPVRMPLKSAIYKKPKTEASPVRGSKCDCYMALRAAGRNFCAPQQAAQIR